MLYSIPFVFLMLSLLNKKFAKYYIIAKVINSLGFICVGLYAGYISNHMMLFYSLLPGFIFCLLGDMILGFYHKTHANKFFLAGLMAFLIAHILFSVCLHSIQPIVLSDFIIPFGSIILTFILSKIPGMNIKKMKPYVYTYSFFVALLFSKSLMIYLSLNNSFSMIMLMGATLFLISDSIIMFLYFYEKKHPLVHVFNLLAYYYGMFMIAISIMY